MNTLVKHFKIVTNKKNQDVFVKHYAPAATKSKKLF